MTAFVNWASETTTTTGAGALTLAPMVPVAPATLSPPRLSTLTVGTQVRYHINAASGAYETGIGTVGVGNTLSRAPTATWDGTTYVASEAVPLALPAGTHTVLCDLAVDDLRFVLSNSAIVYVHPAGNDATAVVGDPSRPFATIAAAIAGRGTAVKFMIDTGAYNCGAGPITWPDGAVVIGNPQGTVLSFDGSLALSTNQCCVQVTPGGASPVHMYDLVIDVALSGTTLCGPVGVTPAGNQSYADIYLHRCRINGKTDALYVGGGATVTMYAIDCQLESNWDLVYATTGSKLFIRGSDLLWKPRKDINTLNSFSWGQCQNGGFLDISGGTLTIDSVGTNTSVTESQWIGLNANVNALGRVSFGGGFRRVDKAPGDAVIPFISCGVGMGSPATPTLDIVGPVQLDLSSYSALQFAINAPPRINPVGGSMWLSFQINATALNTNRGSYWGLSAAALAQNFDLFTLPPGVIVEAVKLQRIAGAAGPTTATAEVGTSGNTTKYLAATDIKTAGAVAMVTPNTEESLGSYANTGTIIRAVVRTTGANISTITAAKFILLIKIGGINM
jgi:hypothetical protein